MVQHPILKASLDIFSYESLNLVTQICHMDVGIRCWNEISNTVESRYINSQFLQRPKAKVLQEKVKEASKELPEGPSAASGLSFG